MGPVLRVSTHIYGVSQDVEVHLLRTNDWMTTHDFPEAVKVQRFA